MPRLAARWSGRSARCDRPGTGREVLVLKGYDEVAVFLGLDVGKQGHHAVAQDRSGKKLLDRALPNDEAKLRELYGRMKVHGPVLLVVDQPATIGALPVAVALDGASPWCISRAWRSAASPTCTDAWVLSGRTPGEKIGRPSAEQAEIARLARELDLTRRRLAKTEAALDL